jgi:hypothetical protein
MRRPIEIPVVNLADVFSILTFQLLVTAKVVDIGAECYVIKESSHSLLAIIKAQEAKTDNLLY